ncbi:hypothetical protein B0T20DRAFT_49062 [Sordaria brevicollis]|uniref:Uncharacterized protein n=1 Tax=Sordaria brevicollis TaxID=83679 RepID=A0AAE0P9W0_SORBR|nr:hypothetical protein B0T20DRAFT_49062 [Sordaria brevicollis]
MRMGLFPTDPPSQPPLHPSLLVHTFSVGIPLIISSASLYCSSLTVTSSRLVALICSPLAIHCSYPATAFFGFFRIYRKTDSLGWLWLERQ